MDARLLAWARAVKSRHRAGPPPLWLFTDSARCPDPLPAIAALPRGLAGVVLRHDAPPEGAPGCTSLARASRSRASLARAVSRLTRARRLALVVAGDVRIAVAVGAGVHLREGRWPGPARPRLRAGTLVTSSAHGRAGLTRAGRAGAALAFLSPAFATASHPGTRPLGPPRWAALARQAHVPVAALGGISGIVVMRLGRTCRGAGAISALAFPRGGRGLLCRQGHSVSGMP